MRSVFFAGVAALALICASPASAQDEEAPARVARLGLVEGHVQQRLAGEPGWQRAEPNIPLTSGDSLRTAGDARAELALGASSLRLNRNTELEVGALDDNTTRLTLNQGSLQLRVHQLYANEQLEINTANLAMVITQPGNYRLDVDPNDATTRVSASSGAAMLYGENGAAVPLTADGQRQLFAGRNLTRNRAPVALRNDDFDLWVANRDRGEEQSVSARFVSRDTIGYQELDQNGDWAADPQYGNVWFPRGVVANWAPYRYGQWRWVSPWGWTWVDDAPWGFAPFHYGRWTQIGSRWAWVPGPRQLRPAYAPALVGYLGGATGVPPASYGGARPGAPPPAHWFPLAPGEAWQPGYRTNPRNLGSINRGALPIEQTRRDGYRFENRPGTYAPAPRAAGPDPFPNGRQDRDERYDRNDGNNHPNNRNDNFGRPPQRQNERYDQQGYDTQRHDPRHDARNDPRFNGNLNGQQPPQRMPLDPYPNGNNPRPMQPRERPPQEQQPMQRPEAAPHAQRQSSPNGPQRQQDNR
ncbi:DUF6600 domain-containing protein [Variovorax sp. HJSM1_2]|uniref:DUF6600 domain-containing protein n=1 Tax=Variovorax sp. HJSM1_2 TaxID=3366263 RepID=UPI003BF4965C